jgi:hypothetical protein
MFENKPDAVRSLNEYLRLNPFWAKLADSITAVTRRLIDTPRWKLSRIRSTNWIRVGDTFETPYGEGKVLLISKKPPRAGADGVMLYEDDIEVSINGETAVKLPVRTLADRSILIDNSRMLGFDFYSDYLDDYEYEKVARFVSRYWAESGIPDFTRFIGFVKGMRLDMHQLWTQSNDDPDNNPTVDYYQSLERLGQQDVPTWLKNGFNLTQINNTIENGTVYPTSHVELEVDIIETPNPDFVGLASLFYYIAPLHLVLERFVSSVVTNTIPTYSHMSAHYDRTDNSLYSWKPDAEITAGYGVGGVVLDTYTAGMLHLNASFITLRRI